MALVIRNLSIERFYKFLEIGLWDYRTTCSIMAAAATTKLRGDVIC
jgi:hypothetical protein